MIKYDQSGINYNNKQVLCLAKVQGYAKAVSTLFRLQKFTLLAHLTDPNNMTAILVNNLLREENIARQQSPLDNTIFAELRQMSESSRDKDLFNDLFFDVVALGRYMGPCLSKYAQTTQAKVNLHTYPSNTTIMKAFVAGNFVFCNSNKHIIKELNSVSLNEASSIWITCQIQKNARITRQSRLLLTRQTPPYVPCVAQCNWFLALIGFFSPMICPLHSTRPRRARFFTSLATRLPSC